MEDERLFRARLLLLRPRLSPVPLSVACLALCVVLAGCSVVMATRQPDEKDLSVLKPGTPRGLVIAELGAPVSSKNEGYGRVDYYKFTQGYGAGTKIGRALFHGVADVFSLGMWEVVGMSTEAAFDGTPVTMKVAYDEQDAVTVFEVLEGENTFDSEDPVRGTVDDAISLASAPSAVPAVASPPMRYEPGYQRKIAAVIGIDDYENWPPLEGAKADAEHVAEALDDMGFDVIEAYDDDATREDILELLGEELQQKATPESLVVVYFAGHGQTETLPNGEKRGYIIPADGDLSSVFSTAISMETIRDLSNRLAAKHVYYVMDSCYSGLGFARAGPIFPPGTEDYVRKVTTRRAVQMITAGQEGEMAMERGGRGLFTSYFLEALTGEADLNGDGFVTSGEIGAYVPARVTAATNSRQTPMFGTLEGSGEVVFERR